jgi:hydrogenase/urease accessory protein HupE
VGLGALVVLLLPKASHAHLVNTGLGPYYDGVSHFTLTPEDLLPALALALLAGQRGSHAGRQALFALPGAWLAGGLAGLAVPTISSATALTTVSLLILGGLVAAEARLRPHWVTGLALVIGLFHGYLNGSAMSAAKLGALGLAGIVTTIFVVVAIAASLVVALRAPWARIAVRVAGSWIAAIGLLLLGWSLRPVDAPRPAPASPSAAQLEPLRHDLEAKARPGLTAHRAAGCIDLARNGASAPARPKLA